MFRRVVDRPIAVLMLSLAAALFGLLAYQQLPISLMPPLSYPTLTVLTNYPGAAPEEVEIEITNLLEERLSTLEGLTEITSRSLSGQSEITLELRWHTNLDRALQRVYERLDRIELPQGISSPQVLRYDPTLDPLFVLSLSPKTTSNSSQNSTDSRAEKQSKLAQTRRYAIDVLSPLLYQVEGVAAVKITGGDQPLIDVKVRTDTLKRLGISIEEVSQTLSSAKVNQAGGLLNTEEGDILIRTLSEINSLEELKNLVIKKLDGQTLNQSDDFGDSTMAKAWVTLSDIAEIKQHFSERTSWVQLNKDPAIRVQVYRQAESDLVSVAKGIRSLLFNNQSKPIKGKNILKIPHPKGLQVEIVSDQAHFIELALSEVNQAILIGGFLAILILYSFLSSWSQTFIIAIAIPLSVVLAFIPLQIFSVSLNLMSLGGLALGVGMLVDNAVVVLESISRRYELGDTMNHAAQKGAAEVGSAVFASTMTTVAVFAPVAFIEGFAGQIFRDLALTVVSALLASLFVALFVVPTLAARLQGFKSEKKSANLPLLTKFKVFDEKSKEDKNKVNNTVLKLNYLPDFIQIWSKGGWYRLKALILFPLFWLEGSLSLIAVALLILGSFILILGKLLLIWPLKLISWPLSYLSYFVQHLYGGLSTIYLKCLGYTLRVPTLLLGSTIFIFAGSYELQKEVPRALLPDVAQGIVIANIDYPVGTTLKGTKRRLETWIDKLLSLDEVRRVDLMIGQDDQEDQPGERRGVHQAKLRITLRELTDEVVIQNQLRSWLLEEPGASLKLSTPSLIHTNSALRVVVKGQQLSVLQESESLIIDLLKQLPRVSDIERTFGQTAPELTLKYDHAKLRYMGLTPQGLATQIKQQLSGLEALELLWDGERIPVKVWAEYAQDLERKQLLNLPINVSQHPENSIPLGAVAKLLPSEGPAEIRHVNGQRAAEIFASVPAFDLNEVALEIERRLLKLTLPFGVDAQTAGQEQEMRESEDELSLVLLLSLFLVFVVMATQFESIRLPLLIMGSVPLALIGVAIGLWLTNTPLSVVVFVGMITLGGVVVNNAIVFIDATERIRQAHPNLGKHFVLKKAGERRLRPIMMTTLTTLFGLLPMYLSPGEGAELRSPLALTLMFGLSFSTLLVLFVIPALYQIFIPTNGDLS